MVQDAFNEIASGWYSFRHWTRFRNELEALAQNWQKGRLLNVGCGHGADSLPFRDKFELHGVDFSVEMLRLAGRYGRKHSIDLNLVLADARRLPYGDESFDRAIAVATYHHLKGDEAKEAALAELRRILRPGGEAFITVWNRWQPRFWFKGREVQVPWRKKDKVLYRYYYLFTYPELERLVKRAGFKILKSAPEEAYHFPLKFFSKNVCLLVKKLPD
jgi:ubiquinone/menaquinone biosynthesis C-methylase UbiE